MGNIVRPPIALFQRASSLVSIELRHLRYAEAAARCSSFRKAADLLVVKQSNLSRRVRHLEEQLGITVFERTNAIQAPDRSKNGVSSYPSVAASQPIK